MPHILSRIVMSPGMLIVSPRMLALAATQRQVARLLLGIDLTTVQHGPLPVTDPRSLKIRIMGAHKASLRMLKTQVTTLTGGAAAGAGTGAVCDDTRVKRSKLKHRKRAAVTRDFVAIFTFDTQEEERRRIH